MYHGCKWNIGIILKSIISLEVLDNCRNLNIYCCVEVRYSITKIELYHLCETISEFRMSTSSHIYIQYIIHNWI